MRSSILQCVARDFLVVAGIWHASPVATHFSILANNNLPPGLFHAPMAYMVMNLHKPQPALSQAVRANSELLGG
jgi:hypothetical protein